MTNYERPEYILHNFIKKSQSLAQKNENFSCKNLDTDYVVVQIDFAKKYKCLFHDEPQSAHFGQEQVSLLTVGIWHDNIFRSVIIATDNCIHDKRKVAVVIIT